MKEEPNILIVEDLEMDDLHVEIEKLNAEIIALENEKAEIEKTLSEFQVRHDRELGELLMKILKHRKETLTNEAKQDKTKQQEANEAQRDYEHYKSDYEINRKKEIRQITDEQKQELKNKFREASKQCHPDIVNDVQKEQASELFRSLKDAYDTNDLETVDAILDNLKQGILIPKADFNEKAELKAQLSLLRCKRDDLAQTITSLKSSETWQTIEKIQDWDMYFANRKKQLENIWRTMK